jgi:hypothetical protein
VVSDRHPGAETAGGIASRVEVIEQMRAIPASTVLQSANLPRPHSTS